MKKVYIIFFLCFLLFTQLTFAQITSKVNVYSYWDQNSTWVNNIAPNQSINGNSNTNIVIDSTSFVTVRSTISGGTLNLDGLTLVVNDYLVIEGDLILGNNAKLNIGGNGKLLIFGNFSSANQVDISTGGLFVVKGNFSMNGSDNQGSFANIGELFINDPTPDIKGTAEGTEQDFTALQSKYPNIYNFISNSSPNPLPVTLLYFNTTAQSNAVEINWASSKAWDFSHYELERSEDGKTFHPIATIDAEENSNETVEYSFTDHNPVFGIAYYRLKAVDIDGKYEYKGIEMVKFGTESFKVYPNPSTAGNVSIDWSHAAQGAVASLRDNTGRTVRTLSLNSQQNKLDTSDLPAGMYFLVVRGAAGVQQTQLMIR